MKVYPLPVCLSVRRSVCLSTGFLPVWLPAWLSVFVCMCVYLSVRVYVCLRASVCAPVCVCVNLPSTWEQRVTPPISFSIINAGAEEVWRGSAQRSSPHLSSTPQEAYLLVSALGPSVGSWGILSLSCSCPSHLMLCHSWCLTQRGQDPQPYGSFSLQVSCHS